MPAMGMGTGEDSEKNACLNESRPKYFLTSERGPTLLFLGAFCSPKFCSQGQFMCYLWFIYKGDVSVSTTPAADDPEGRTLRECNDQCDGLKCSLFI